MDLRDSYMNLHKASGIKAGDRVRILRNPHVGEIAWTNKDWSFSVGAPGNEARVASDDGLNGFILDGAGIYAGYPFFCIEKIIGSERRSGSMPPALQELADLAEKKKRKK